MDLRACGQQAYYTEMTLGDNVDMISWICAWT